MGRRADRYLYRRLTAFGADRSPDRGGPRDTRPRPPAHQREERMNFPGPVLDGRRTLPVSDTGWYGEQSWNFLNGKTDRPGWQRPQNAGNAANHGRNPLLWRCRRSPRTSWRDVALWAAVYPHHNSGALQ